MEIIRNNETFKIKLPLYKIHIKEVKNKNSNNYQYTCILPPLLCSYFRINKETIKEKEPNIIIYTYQKEVYISSLETILEYKNISLKQHELNNLTEMFNNITSEIPEDLQRHKKELPLINYNLYDKIEDLYYTTAYNLTNSNSFRFTLTNRLFKNLIDITKDNYIIFTIDTLNKDILNNYGTVKLEIIQE